MTLIYWKDSLIGITALMIMCGGDGIADIVGRRINSPKLAWSPEKSVAGSLSVFLGGSLLAVIIIAIFVWMGAFAAPFSRYLVPVAWVSFGAMLVESLPFKDVDNITITLGCIVFGTVVF